MRSASRKWGFVALGVIALGCSDAARGSGRADQDAAPADLTPDSGALSGVVELTVTSFVTDEGPHPPGAQSFTYRVQIDLSDPRSDAPAIVTPLGSAPALYGVEHRAEAMVLTPDLDGARADSVPREVDVWHRIEIRGIEFAATVERHTSCGDCGWTNTLDVKGTVAPDAHAPVFSVATSVRGGDVFLPWSVRLDSDESVLAPEWQSRATVAVAGGDHQVEWAAEPPVPGTERTGVRALGATLATFTPFEGGANLTVRVVAGVRDAAANESGAFEATAWVQALGALRDAVDFSASPGETAWGKVSSSTAPFCGGASCWLLGPNNRYGSGSGLAARLRVGPARRIVVEARRFGRDGWGETSPMLSVAVAGGRTVEVPLFTGEEVTVPTAAGDDANPAELGSEATSWVTRELEVPAGASEVGVAVRSQTLENEGPDYPQRTLLVRRLEAR